jgi:hypothetical protein
LMPLLPGNIKNEVDAIYQSGNQYIAVAHPLSPNPLFLNNAEGLLLFNHDSYQFILKEDLDFQPLASNDPSRELSIVNKVNKSISSSENFDVLNSAVSSRGSLMTAALLIGLAQKMLDLSSAYAVDRTQFGKPIGSFQAVKHMLADVAVAIEFAKPAIYRAAYSLSDQNPKSVLHCSHAKYMTARAAELACKNSIQAHGAMGYTWEMDLHIYMRKAWSLMACWGNEDKQQDTIYKTLTSSKDELGVLYTF